MAVESIRALYRYNAYVRIEIMKSNVEYSQNDIIDELKSLRSDLNKQRTMEQVVEGVLKKELSDVHASEIENRKHYLAAITKASTPRLRIRLIAGKSLSGPVEGVIWYEDGERSSQVHIDQLIDGEWVEVETVFEDE